VDVIGNLVLPNEATGGLSFAGNQGAINARIFNNTFYNAYVDIGSPSATGNIDFRNNIIYELDDIPLRDAGNKITSHANNLLFRAGGGTLVSIGGANYTAANLATWEATAKSADPLLKNPGNLPSGFSGAYGTSLAPNSDGLSVQAGSPATDAGADLSALYNGSINSAQRPVGAGWDVGAYEGTASILLSAPRNLQVVRP
jgi:hypothetical protein